MIMKVGLIIMQKNIAAHTATAIMHNYNSLLLKLNKGAYGAFLSHSPGTVNVWGEGAVGSNSW